MVRRRTFGRLAEDRPQNRTGTQRGGASCPWVATVGLEVSCDATIDAGRRTRVREIVARALGRCAVASGPEVSAGGDVLVDQVLAVQHILGVEVELQELVRNLEAEIGG